MSLAWRAVLWIVAVLVVGGLITWGTLLITAATSETKGALDAQIQINQGKNQVASQELFEDLFAKIKEHDVNLDAAAQAVKDDPSSFNKTNYTGLVMICNQAVAQYNAEARKISRGKWMSADLPYEIDPTNAQADARFDCKETGK